MIMESHEERLSKVVEEIDRTLDSIGRAWKMWGSSALDIELRCVELLHIRSIALGYERPDWRRWCSKKYPEIPGPTRSTAYAMRQRHRDQPESVFQHAFGEALTEMIHDIRQGSEN